MKLNTTMLINLEEVEQFIESDEFIQFLLNNTTDLGTCAFILQTIHEKIEELSEGDN